MLPFLSICRFWGGIRRWLIPAFGWAPMDPLILVQAAVIGLYAIGLVAGRRLPTDTRLVRCLYCLLGIMALEIFNPLQGGITVGLAGILFVMVPALWYFAGRQMGTPQIVLNLICAALILSFLGAVYGMYQLWFGYIPSEQTWININKILDLRVFSFFTLMAEYGVFVAIGIAILWAAFLKGNRAAFLPIPFLAAALFFIGERSVVVDALFTCAVLWAVQGRSLRAWLPRVLLALALGMGGLVWSLHQAQQVDFGGNAQAAVEHQTSGLLDPGHSTAASHVSMISGGILEGFRSPLGHGLGATTLAAGKFGTGSITTESDWGDSFVSLGLPGGLLYTFMIGLIFTTAVRQWNQTRSFVALAILGILLAGFRCWLNGNFYATSMLMWFLIGAQDRAARISQVVPKFTQAVPKLRQVEK